MAKNNRRRETSETHEWLGGLYDLPLPVEEEGRMQRVAVLFWVDGETGMIVGMEVGKRTDLLKKAGKHLAQTIRAPMTATAAPTQIRVAGPALAKAIRAANRSLGVNVRPTPELDEIFASIEAEMVGQFEESDADYSFFGGGLEPEGLASFFRSAAALWKRAPWEVIEKEDCVLSVSFPDFDRADMPMVVIGQNDEHYGVLLFESITAYAEFVQISETAADNAGKESERPILPPMMTINFEPGSNIPTSQRKEISQHRWEVAAANAYPMPTVSEESYFRPPTPDELTLLDAAAAAFAQLIDDERERLLETWIDDVYVDQTYEIPIADEMITVRIQAPWTDPEPLGDTVSDALRRLSGIEMSGASPTEARREASEAIILREFATSPEIADLDADLALGDIGFFMDIVARHIGATVVTLTADEFAHVIFTLLPFNLVMRDDSIGPLIDALRAFYRFLQREAGLPADDHLSHLGDDAVDRFISALNPPDDAQLSVGKQLIAYGKASGFDLESEEGIREFMKQIEGKKLPDSIILPGDPPAAPKKKPTGKTKGRGKKG